MFFCWKNKRTIIALKLIQATDKKRGLESNMFRRLITISFLVFENEAYKYYFYLKFLHFDIYVLLLFPKTSQMLKTKK